MVLLDRDLGSKCRSCGCSELNTCRGGPVGACWWVEDDLCSFCVVALDRSVVRELADEIRAKLKGAELVYDSPSLDALGPRPGWQTEALERWRRLLAVLTAALGEQPEEGR